MLQLLSALLRSAFSTLQTHRELALENLALRQQLALLLASAPKPRITPIDRAFWSVFSRVCADWRHMLVIVKPETVVRWHRRSFRAFWTWRSRPIGRPTVDPKTVALVLQMANANPRWGAPRIHGELRKLGIVVSQATVSKHMPKRPPRMPRGGQTWKTFLANHVPVSMDMFTVPTATFRVLYGFVVVDHVRRVVRHVATTEHPTSAWIAQQLRNAFPGDEPIPKRILRDRDGAYGQLVPRVLRSMGIEEVLTAARSPWQNAYVERWIGTLRRDMLDHVIVLNELHLLRLLREYVTYYHDDRTHLGLAKDTPIHRDVERPDKGANIIGLPRVGGLHHRYTRKAA